MMNKLITTCLNQFKKVFGVEPELGIQITRDGNTYTFLIDHEEIGCPYSYRAMDVEITEEVLNNPHKLWRVILKGWQDVKLEEEVDEPQEVTEIVEVSPEPEEVEVEIPNYVMEDSDLHNMTTKLFEAYPELSPTTIECLNETLYHVLEDCNGKGQVASMRNKVIARLGWTRGAGCIDSFFEAAIIHILGRTPRYDYLTVQSVVSKLASIIRMRRTPYGESLYGGMPAPKCPIEIEASKATTKSELRSIKRTLSRKHHPDVEGGSVAMMTKVNTIIDEAMKQL